MLTRPPAFARARDPTRERRRLAQQRYRRNKKDHVTIAPVKVDELIVDYLVRVVRWLDDADAHDARKIGEAITRGLTEAATAEAKR